MISASVLVPLGLWLVVTVIVIALCHIAKIGDEADEEQRRRCKR